MSDVAAQLGVLTPEDVAPALGCTPKTVEDELRAGLEVRPRMALVGRCAAPSAGRTVDGQHAVGGDGRIGLASLL